MDSKRYAHCEVIRQSFRSGILVQSYRSIIVYRSVLYYFRSEFIFMWSEVVVALHRSKDTYVMGRLFRSDICVWHIDLLYILDLVTDTLDLSLDSR